MHNGSNVTFLLTSISQVDFVCHCAETPSTLAYLPSFSFSHTPGTLHLRTLALGVSSAQKIPGQEIEWLVSSFQKQKFKYYLLTEDFSDN